MCSQGKQSSIYYFIMIHSKQWKIMYIVPFKIFREKIRCGIHIFIINKRIISNREKSLQQPIIIRCLYAFILKSNFSDIIITTIRITKYIKLLEKNIL